VELKKLVLAVETLAGKSSGGFPAALPSPVSVDFRRLPGDD